MMARPNCAAVWGTTWCSTAPSRTCKCQSSGRVSVKREEEGQEGEVINQIGCNVVAVPLGVGLRQLGKDFSRRLYGGINVCLGVCGADKTGLIQGGCDVHPSV
ncbi:MAG: hypothetical protein RLZZ612_2645 [Pseudomonadota bacterium]